MKIVATLATLGFTLGVLGSSLPARADERSALSDGQCAALSGLVIPASQIGLPTAGAKVTTASTIAGNAEGHVPPHCLVAGEISPVDKDAPNIEFNVALPTEWNGKAFMLGGGGFNGFIPEVASRLTTGEASPSPLERGYAVFSSDSGHKSRTPPFILDSEFALNEEAYLNYMGDALKKTRDVASAVIRKAFGSTPAKSYFIGGSNGGREALVVAGRWPDDWDGIVASYPARNGMVMAMQGLRVSQLLATPGGFISPEKRSLVYKAALETCDGIDGAEDGIISNVKGCHALFDPAEAMSGGAPLRCPNGADGLANCLSDTELTVLRKIDAPTPLPFKLPTGDTHLLGFNVYTSDTGRPPNSQMQAAVTMMAFGLKPPASQFEDGMSFFYQIANKIIRYMVVQDPDFDPFSFDIANPGPYANRLRKLSEIDARDLDLARFAGKGGKLIILQGTDDMEVNARLTEAYYLQLRDSLGDEVADHMIRYYEVPGFGHGRSTIFRPVWDPVTAIEAWVEDGKDPANDLVGTDMAGKPGRTRPLCQYPLWPKYEKGDVDAASSFVCSQF